MSFFVDANVIVKAFTECREKESCREVLFNGFRTDVLCLIEAQDTIERIRKNKPAAAKFIRSLFGLNCDIVPLDRNLLMSGLRIHASTDFNIFNAIHYTTALIGGCSGIVSYDRDFDGLPIPRIEP